MVEVASSKNATLGAFSPPQQSEGTRRDQSPLPLAIEDNLAGPTIFPNRCFYFISILRSAQLSSECRSIEIS